MTEYPVLVRRLSRRAPSTTGGKDYHMVLIATNDAKRALFVTRWGKRAQWGTGFKVEPFNSIDEAAAAWDSKMREKYRGGYRESTASAEKFHHDEDALRVGLGSQYLNSIGADHLKWLIPSFNTTGLRAGPQQSVEWERTNDGRYIPRDNRRLVPGYQLGDGTEPAAQAPEEPPVETIPGWGAW